MAIGRLIVDLLANVAGFESDLARAARTAQKEAGKIDKAFDFGPLKLALAGAASAAGAAFGAIAASALKAADEVNNASQRVGISAESFSALAFAAQQSDVSMSDLQKGLIRVSLLAGQAAAGNEEAAGKFKALGVAITNDELGKADVIFAKIAAAVGKFPEGAQQAAAANEIFGKSFAKYLPLLQSDLAAATARAEELNAVVSGELAASSALFFDQLDEVSASATGLANTLLEATLPAINGLLASFIEASTKGGVVAESAAFIGDALKGLALAAITVKNAFETMAQGLVFGVGALREAAQFAKDALLDLTVGIANASKAAANFNPAGLLAAVRGTAQNIGQEFDQAVNAQSAAYDSFLGGVGDAGADIAAAWDALYTGVTAAAEAARLAAENADKLAASQAAADAQAKSAAATQLKLAAATKAAAAAASANAEQQKADAARQAEQEKNAQNYINLVKRLEQEFDPAAAAAREFEEAVDVLLAEMARGVPIGKEWAETLLRAQLKLNEATEAAKPAVTAFENVKRSLIEQIEAVRNSSTAFGDNARALEIAEAKLEALNQALADGKPVSAESRAEIEALAETLYKLKNPEMFDFAGAIAKSISEGFKAGSASAGVRSFFSAIRSAFSRANGESGAAFAQRATEGAVNFLGQIAEIRNAAVNSDGNAVGSALRSLNSLVASSNIPIASWIARAVGALDSLSGNRIFGTDFARVSSNSTVNFGATGNTGQTSATDSRRTAGITSGVLGFLTGGLLGSRRVTRVTNTPFDPNAQRAIDELFEQSGVAMAQAARTLSVSVPARIAAIFKQEFDKDGKLTAEFVTVLGIRYNEGLQQAAQRVNAENVILVIGQVSSAVSALAEPFRATSQRLAEFASFALIAQADITRAAALLGEGADLTSTLALVQDQAVAGEQLAQTYARLQQALSVYQTALQQFGQEFEGTRVQFIEFAADLAESLGGVNEAARLFDSYFQNFYSDIERSQQVLDATTAAARRALQALDIEPSISLAGFRDRFESLLPTLTPEQVGEYLRAAEALARMNAAATALADASTVNAQELADAIAATAQASADYAQFLGGFGLNETLSELGAELAQAAEQGRANIRTANELSFAANGRAASERELALVYRFTNNQIAAITARLRAAAQSLTTQLFGLPDAAPEITNAFVNGANQASTGFVNTLTDGLISAFEALQSWLDQSFIGPLSGLAVVDQFAAARGQLNAAFAAAQGGDASAISDLPRLLSQFLELSRRLNGSTGAFAADAAFARDLANQITSLQGQFGGGGNPGAFGGGEVGAAVATAVADLSTFERAGIARELAQYLREIATIERSLGATALSVAEGLEGFDLTRFVAEFGVDLSTLTVETALGLTSIAAQLGVDITELADGLSISLGALNDQSSLINDALEAAIGALPDGIGDELGPLLRAVEEAQDSAGQALALANLTAAVGGLSPDFRNQLAPFFENIDPISELDNIANLTSDTARAVNSTTGAVISTGGATVEAVGLGASSIVTAIAAIAPPPPSAMAASRTEQSLDRLARIGEAQLAEMRNQRPEKRKDFGYLQTTIRERKYS